MRICEFVLCCHRELILRTWLGVLFFSSATVNAACVIYHQNKPLEHQLKDPLYHLLTQAEHCPVSPSELKILIAADSLSVHSHMVANRGRNNPAEGSFSFFESIDGTTNNGQEIRRGDFFIGYFTHEVDKVLHLDEQPVANKLLLESIVWDSEKQMYNFYELKGENREDTRWYYRGDSRDAYLDNARLYRFDPKEAEHFGKRMRCSACHNSGGPIMKETALPNSDWWKTNRHLPFAPNAPDATIQNMLVSLEDAMQLSQSVDEGMKHVQESKSMSAFKQSLTLQEPLRPLFCTVEINLESANQDENTPISIPSSFWLNPLLNHELFSVMSINDYQHLLDEFEMRFPETNLRDADRAWLTPVAGVNDNKAIEALMNQHIISRRFIDAVLMIDFKHPIFSKARCNLLQLVPEQFSGNWQEEFRQNLLKSGTKEGLLLARYLDQMKPHDKELLLRKYEREIQRLLKTESGRRSVFSRLLRQRKAVSKAEMSQNPLGEILEPGFRVIFPVSHHRVRKGI